MYANKYAQVIETFSAGRREFQIAFWIDTRWPWASCTSKVQAGSLLRHLTNTGICEMRVCSNAAAMGVTAEAPSVEVTQRRKRQLLMSL